MNAGAVCVFRENVGPSPRIAEIQIGDASNDSLTRLVFNQIVRSRAMLRVFAKLNVIVRRSDHLHALQIGAPTRRCLKIPNGLVNFIRRSMKDYFAGYDMLSRQRCANKENYCDDCENENCCDEDQFHPGCFICRAARARS